MAAVEYSDFVPCDLQDIARFLTRSDARMAARFLDAVDDTVRFLAVNRHAGPERLDVPVPDLRAWSVDGFPRYLIFYRAEPSGIHVIRVLHASRDFKSVFPSE